MITIIIILVVEFLRYCAFLLVITIAIMRHCLLSSENKRASSISSDRAYTTILTSSDPLYSLINIWYKDQLL